MFMFLKRAFIFSIIFMFLFTFAGCHGNQNVTTTDTTAKVKNSLLDTADEFGKAQAKAINQINAIVAEASKKNILTVEQEKKYMEVQHKIVKAQILYAGILDKVEAGSMSSLNVLSASAEFLSTLVEALDLVESFGIELPSDLKKIKEGLKLVTVTG